MAHRIVTQNGKQFSIGGRKRPKPGRVRLHFNKYAVSLPTPPATVSYSAFASSALSQERPKRM